MSNYLSEIFKEVPDFLSILGYQDCYHDKESDEWVVEYLPSKNLTHSNGTVVQGGFVSGMVDSAMSQFIIYLSKGKEIPLTLDLDVKFLKQCDTDVLVIANGKIKRNPKTSVANPGIIRSNAAKAIAAPEIIS